MLKKSIKDHPIVVGKFYQWIVSNYWRKEAIEANIMANKIKDKVDELSSSTTFTANSINELKNFVDSVNKSADTTIRKIGSLTNKWWSSEEDSTQGSCNSE